MVSKAYIITSIIVILLPGPGAIYTVSSALKGSIKKGFIAALGCTFGIIPHLILGIIALYTMHQLPEYILQFIKFIGALYLAFLGFKILTDKGEINLSSTSIENSNLKVFFGGIFLNLLNPKLTLFFISFLPQYIIQRDSTYIIQAILLGLIFMLLTLLVFIFYGLLANEFRKKLLKSSKSLIWISRIFGIIFIFFALKLYF